MDSQFPPTREELYHIQMDVKHVQAVQINQGERLLRLEKRQADDAALKSVWGTGSPFPSVLSGTPLQGPVQHPPADVFDDFDDEQSHNLLGSLQLEADEEPVRRGASRANSVRFDVSALQRSNWNINSRHSGDFGPVRPGSGIGSHPMTERSSSHKSDGRHSSAGHSVHSMHSNMSGRNSSLGLNTNFVIGGQDDDSPLDTPDPPPGLFILGSVPSIIRCWLSTNFSHNSLMYADVCSGSQRSVLDYSLVKELGLAGQIRKDLHGRHHIRLPVYLPEAVITQPSSRSNSPAPQLPTLSANFEIVGLSQRSTPERKGIRIILGSDTLRAHNADIFFSQNFMTLYGDDRNKLSVPFVRPEDESLFKNLCTANIPVETKELKAAAAPFTPTDARARVEVAPEVLASALSEKLSNKSDQLVDPKSLGQEPESASTAALQFPVSTPEVGFSERVISAKGASTTEEPDSENPESDKQQASEPESIPERKVSSESSRRDSVGIWGSWRQNASENTRDSETTSGYQRAARGRSMKVLKPSSSKQYSATAVPTRQDSATRTSHTYEPAPSRPATEMRRKSQAENAPLKWESKRVSSEEVKRPTVGTGLAGVVGSLGNVPRSENPVGGASAFSWMATASKKATTAE